MGLSLCTRRHTLSESLYKDLHGPKADPVELSMIPMSTTTRAMLDPDAEEVDSQTDAEQISA